METRLYLRGLIRPTDNVLEIGPGPHPVAPKALGFKTTVTDFQDKQAVVNTFAAHGLDTSSIEDVDFVTNNLGDLIEKGLRFDKIVASHVIEHTPDMISFLAACQGLLAEGGRVLLIAPDKRFDFDFYRPISSTGNLLDAYRSKKRNHFGAAFDMVANQATVDGQLSWPRSAGSVPVLKLTMEEAKRTIDHATATSGYVDSHEWVFTPTSFRLLLSDLRGLELIDLREEFFGEREYEFICILSRTARAERIDRLEYLNRIEDELLAVSRRRRAPDPIPPSRLGRIKGFVRAMRAALKS